MKFCLSSKNCLLYINNKQSGDTYYIAVVYILSELIETIDDGGYGLFGDICEDYMRVFSMLGTAKARIPTAIPSQ